MAPRVYDSVVIDDRFEREFEVDVLMDLPTSRALRRYNEGSSGPILKVRPHDGEPFIIIVGGSVSTLQLMSWPNPRAFVVNSTLLVNIDDPGADDCLPGFEGHKVHFLVALPREKVVLMGHCCGVYCHGASGLRWAYQRRYDEDFKAVEVSGDEVTVLANRYQSNAVEPVRILLSLSTGEGVA